MTDGLTGRGGAIMTTGTGTGNAGVIDPRPRPAAGAMANLTGLAGLDMGSCLAHGNTAVVAAGAGTAHMGVIHAGDRHPVTGTVTGFAAG